MINMVDKEIIIKNFEEYFEMANLAFIKKKFNSAVTLYYKALVEICDMQLLEKNKSDRDQSYRKIPTSKNAFSRDLLNKFKTFQIL